MLQNNTENCMRQSIVIDWTCLDERQSNPSSTAVQAAYTHLGNCFLLPDNVDQLQIKKSIVR